MLSSSLFVLDFPQYCDFPCILLGSTKFQDDEEEGVQGEERGDADQYVSVVLGDSRHTRSYRRAASSAAASRVDPMSDHCMVSTVLYAMPCPNKHYTQTLVTL